MIYLNKLRWDDWTPFQIQKARVWLDEGEIEIVVVELQCEREPRWCEKLSKSQEEEPRELEKDPKCKKRPKQRQIVMFYASWLTHDVGGGGKRYYTIKTSILMSKWLLVHL